jgi:pimeloyl-ACP methyl ester carboxylesterase
MGMATGSSWRRWLKITGLGLLTLVVLAVVVGAIYEQVARRNAARAFPPPGKLVDIGGRRIHLDCRGQGKPIVILESGADPSGSTLWFPVQQAIAPLTRVCAYDRAGLMWSDPAPGERNGVAIANDLHRALEVAREPRPYVLVGASIGGPYVMTFTKYFGQEVAGLVFVDAAHPEQTRRLAEATGRADEEIPVVFRVLAHLAWTGLPRLLLPAAQVPELPAQIAKAITAYQPVSLGPAFDEAAAFDATFREAGTFRSLGDRPLAVLSRGKPWSAYTKEQQRASGFTPEQFSRQEAAWRAMQNEEVTWSSQSTHWVLENSSHVIQLERPDAVIDAIREVVAKVRARRDSAS